MVSVHSPFIGCAGGAPPSTQLMSGECVETTQRKTVFALDPISRSAGCSTSLETRLGSCVHKILF